MTGRVKWFDNVRGYGFLIPDAEDGDILLHFSLLQAHGRRALPEGATVTCEVVDGPRGRQATSVTAIDLDTATGPDPEAPRASRLDAADLENVGEPEQCQVKWFNRAKGYGFILREADDRDVFVHMETVRDGGLSDLLPGQPVMARIADGKKGPLAVEISPMDGTQGNGLRVVGGTGS